MAEPQFRDVPFRGLPKLADGKPVRVVVQFRWPGQKRPGVSNAVGEQLAGEILGTIDDGQGNAFVALRVPGGLRRRAAVPYGPWGSVLDADNTEWDLKDVNSPRDREGDERIMLIRHTEEPNDVVECYHAIYRNGELDRVEGRTTSAVQFSQLHGGTFVVQMREWNAGLVKRPGDTGPAQWREGNTGQFFASKGGERGRFYCTDAEGNAVLWRAAACIGPTLDSKDGLPLDEIDFAGFSSAKDWTVSERLFDAAGKVPFVMGLSGARTSTGVPLKRPSPLVVPGNAGPGAHKYKITARGVVSQLVKRETDRLANLEKGHARDLEQLHKEGATAEELARARLSAEQELQNERERSADMLARFTPHIPLWLDGRFPFGVDRTCPNRVWKRVPGAPAGPLIENLRREPQQARRIPR